MIPSSETPTARRSAGKRPIARLVEILTEHRRQRPCNIIYRIGFFMKQKSRSNGYKSNNPPASEELLTVEQVATNWQVSQRMIRRMIADGRLPVIRLGRAVRVSVTLGRTRRSPSITY
jgi:excisionase family DNA binding protein